MKIKHAFLFFGIIITASYVFLITNRFNRIHDEDKTIVTHSKSSGKETIDLDTLEQLAEAETSNILVDYYESEILLGALKAPDSLVSKMALLDVQYLGYDSLIHQGQIIVNNSVANEVRLIFDELLIARFPIEKVIPAIYYKWNDDSSMFYNNSSSFNYRRVKNSSKLSSHSLGLAIDINPRENPHIDRFGNISPSNGVYNSSHRGTITESSQCFKIFKKYGWKWGGHWRYSKDYQHFSKSGQ